jgi:mono/diheme cytochrome c family protein
MQELNPRASLVRTPGCNPGRPRRYIRLRANREAIEAGRQLYDMNCASCHGDRMINPGSSFDLRKLHPNEKGRFDAVVLNGKGTQMPPWQGTLSPEEIDQLWAYVRENAFD